MSPLRSEIEDLLREFARLEYLRLTDGSSMPDSKEFVNAILSTIAEYLEGRMPEKYDIKDHKNIGDGTGYYHDIGYNQAIDEVLKVIEELKE